MILRIIKIAVALLIVNACFRGGVAAWNYYQLKDETEQMIRFAGSDTTATLHNRVVAKATEMGVPVQPENVTVRREGTRTLAQVSYRQMVEFVPTYSWPIDFSFRVEAFSLNPAPPEETSR
jgi:hypothetical protein